ncbi:MAG: flagellar biosynthesis repressor FlbT [Rhodospirillaceae bacterium]|nr:flagellar biosynthesis repressor FlbT [Rhodospirillales bacterium]
MPLLIDLKPGEKVIINGAVIENAGTNTKIRVHNEANILRQKEIIGSEDIATPSSRVYYCLQCAYIFQDKRDYYLGLFEGFLDDYVAACPSALGIASDIRNAVTSGHYYKALKTSRKLLKHEADVLTELEATSEQLRDTIDAAEMKSEE